MLCEWGQIIETQANYRFRDKNKMSCSRHFLGIQYARFIFNQAKS
ncbi:hypothetical protein C427_5515 [Paraglaciecola psychrophila 170]|uniref:Uncharacterized protein n=1 Tax=Paraglaciecola psychrophila 170 TaxID=1129794 RepID=K6ZW01_9ALTE|nr:hypothetical protein C427_5515 [Paraglaciecola psychrophila 170]GAC40066.1 hypothetical protein GPSY_4463 [Paraglaciecola psychrophila 170]